MCAHPQHDHAAEYALGPHAGGGAAVGLDQRGADGHEIADPAAQHDQAPLRLERRLSSKAVQLRARPDGALKAVEGSGQDERAQGDSGATPNPTTNLRHQMTALLNADRSVPAGMA